MSVLFVRWTAISWPHKIERQMEQTYAQLDEDEERFRKLQQSDQTNFEDRLDTLQVNSHTVLVWNKQNINIVWVEQLEGNTQYLIVWPGLFWVQV